MVTPTFGEFAYLPVLYPKNFQAIKQLKRTIFLQISVISQEKALHI